MNRATRVLASLSTAMLLLAACAPAAPSPTAAPAKPAAQPTTAPAQPTTAPAKPAEAKPAASPAVKTETKPAASPAAKAEAKPAASPAAKAAMKPEAIQVPKPAGSLAFKHAYSSVAGYADMPLFLTSERLNKEGWQIQDVSLAQSELAVESTTKGETGFGNGASVAVLRAIEQGAKLAMVAERTANEWVIASKTELKQCTDLNTKRLAVHSEGSVSTAMVKNWVDTSCKGTSPNYIIIAGSENRAAALVNGQIDATPLELADWLNVNKQAPGKFHLLENFSQGLPDLATTPIYINREWGERNRPVAVAYLAELMKTHRMIAVNPQLMLDAVKKHIPSLASADIMDIYNGYQGINAFDVNGGLTASKVEGTIKFFTDAQQLKPGMSAQAAADLSYLEEALKIVGKQ